MKVILLIITVMTLVIGASINSMALTLAEQIYAAMFYIMALLSFCTFALLFKGRVNWKCNWLLKECGLEEEAERNRPLPPEETTEMLVLKKRRHCLPTGTAVLSNVVVSFASDVKSSALQSFFYGWHKKFGFRSMYQACLFRGGENTVRNG